MKLEVIRNINITSDANLKFYVFPAHQTSGGYSLINNKNVSDMLSNYKNFHLNMKS